MIIILSGPIASGKSTIAERTAALTGARHASFGDYVRHLAGVEGERHRTTLRKVGQKLVESDPAMFVRDFLVFAQFCPGEPFVIDGLRHQSILNVLRKIAAEADEPIALAYVHVDDAVRKQRLRDRGLSEHEIEVIDDDPSEHDVVHCLKGEALIVLDGAGSVDQAVAELLAITSRR